MLAVLVLLADCCVKGLKFPALSVVVIVTSFHRQLVFLLIDGEALLADAVVQPHLVVAVLPFLVAATTMAREENHILA